MCTRLRKSISYVSPHLLTEKTFPIPDSGQSEKRKSFKKVPGDLKYKTVRKQSWTYVVFLCSAFLLAPVKQETLERTSSLKEK